MGIHWKAVSVNQGAEDLMGDVLYWNLSFDKEQVFRLWSFWGLFHVSELGPDDRRRIPLSLTDSLAVSHGENFQAEFCVYTHTQICIYKNVYMVYLKSSTKPTATLWVHIDSLWTHALNTLLRRGSLTLIEFRYNYGVQLASSFESATMNVLKTYNWSSLLVVSWPH